ncbi:type VI secretion system membrane subunit TssM [Paraburkholderia sp.]|uniref:type VI secretion system membrane subunit TssM n=1 Tax=Paraburkholderia sp. TaxID=1926495 RepID=UPI002383EDAF|nr:type VI secretion system membrane subunit TssM [Paraburkholderia sp.]MDE1183221.1 type VI secretion system membrane subunit TssM [Paraburkholderia sp.]
MNALKRLLRLLVSRMVWRALGVVLGVVLVVALIWWIGPLLAIGEMRPIESVASRCVLIGVVLSVWVLRALRRAHRRGVFAGWRVGNASSVGAPGAPDPELERLEALRARFRDALAVLHRPPHRTGRLAALRDALTGRSSDNLPWYLVVGSRGAGKTAALVNSGLALPIADQAARAASGRVEPTTQCEWWFCDDAVLIDTPGDLLDAAGHAEWRELLTLLKKHRPRQPVNGVLLTVPIHTLLALDEAGCKAYATRLRQPLQALQATLDVRVPVYLCFTQMDRIGGFCDYFSSLNRDERAQVWGTTFEANDAAVTESASQAFDALRRRLDEGLSDVLLSEPDVTRRARAFLFPQQFASVRQAHDDFCAALFCASPLDVELHARGIYFTSAQQGAPEIDRVLAPIHDRLRIEETAVPTRANVGHASRHGFFLTRLLHDALFADAGFAGVSRAVRRQRRVQVAAVIVTALMMATLLAGWTISYSNNRAYLDEVNAHVVALGRLTGAAAQQPVADLPSLTAILDGLRGLPDSARFDVAAPPWSSYRMGLYQGDRIDAASQAVYRRALDEKLLPLAAARIETLLANAPAADAEYSYDALKAYLMLYTPAHYDAAFLAAWLILDAEAALPSGMPQDERARVEAHLTRLFESRNVTAPFPMNATLVERVRGQLAQSSVAQRAYRLLRRELLRSMRDDPVTLAGAGGPQAALVLTRKSGRPLTEGVAPLYTYRGYWDVFSTQVDGVTARLRRDDPWVLGIAATPEREQNPLAVEVRRAYFNDYIDVWDAYLDDVTLVASTSITQSTQIARTLSAPDSPLRQFLQVASNETSLVRKPEATVRQVAEPLQRKVGEAREALVAMFGRAAPVAVPAEDSHPEAMVDRHFDALHRLVGGDAGNTPLDGTLRTIDALYGYLTSANAALASGTPPPQTDVFDKLQADAGRLPLPLRTLFGALGQTGAGQLSGAMRQNVRSRRRVASAARAGT